MTAGISLIPGKTGAHRAPQLGSGTIPGFFRNLLDNTTSTTLVQNVQDNPAGEATSRTLRSVVETRSFNSATRWRELPPCIARQTSRG